MIFFNDKFREIRKEKKIKLTELAEQMELNRNTLWIWESGRTVPSEKKVRLAAKLLKVSVDKISNLMPEETPIADSIDYSQFNATLSKVANINIHEQENIQTYLIKKIQEQFRELNPTVSLVSTFLNSIPLICYAKDVSGKYIIANKAFLKNTSMRSKQEKDPELHEFLKQ